MCWKKSLKENFYFVKFVFSKKATKIDEILTVNLRLSSKCQIDGEDFDNFCGLLRKHELYLLEPPWSLPRLPTMGFVYLLLNSFSLPRNPGIKKSNRDHNSMTLFWIGVPDKINRWWACKDFMAKVVLVLAFLMAWPRKKFDHWKNSMIELTLK